MQIRVSARWLAGTNLLLILISLPVGAASVSQRVRTWFLASPEERAAMSLGAEFLGRGEVPIQQYDNTCGPAALMYALSLLGVEATEEELAKLSGTTPEGTSMLGLMQAARTFGFDAAGYRVDPADVDRLPIPAVLFLPARKHFVVLTEVTPDSVHVADPALGHLKFTRHSLARHWKGEVLLLQPDLGPSPALGMDTEVRTC